MDFENEYFSDGIIEEIINVLIKIKGLKVIVWIFVFVYKNKLVDIWEIGCWLGVANFLEGSVCKFGNKVCIIV